MMWTTAILMSIVLQAQPATPAKPTPPVEPPKVAKPTPVAQAPKPETLDQQIQRAMTSHPDLRIAQLQVELAAAKLEQEKQRVMQRISAARASRDGLKVVVDSQAKLTAISRRAGLSEAEVLVQEDKLAQSQHTLAVAEAELQAATSTAESSKLGVVYLPEQPQIKAAQNWLHLLPPLLPPQKPAPVQFEFGQAPAKGFMADFPEMLDRPVTPVTKTGTPRVLITELLSKAAGDKPIPAVRLSQFLEETPNQNVAPITLSGTTETLSAWLEQLTDGINVGPNGSMLEPGVKYAFYVREYGLLCVTPDDAPAGALTINEFRKKRQAESQSPRVNDPQSGKPGGNSFIFGPKTKS